MACSPRREPGLERQVTTASASASASGAAVFPKRKRQKPGPPAPPPPPAVTPGVPPQLVACGTGRDFYRITDEALEVFEVSKKVPPPQVRGSAAAVQVASIPMAKPLNVIPFAKQGVLVIGTEHVWRYEPGHKSARTHAPIPADRPLVAWVDPERPGSVWVRTFGEKTIRQYTATAAPTLVPAPREQALPDFDARLFTVLGDGSPLYSTPAGLERPGDAAQAVPLPKLAETATLLFPDVTPERYWAADARGNVGLWDPERGTTPLFSARVPGAVIDVALEGARVAVLSIEAAGQNYQPTVTVFSEGRELGRRRVSGTPALHGQPKLDLCLIPGRPWVVVGGTRWMQLVDWETPRLLAEW
ncbi:MAG TPA: hypothetical protein VFU02_11590 [Polyangiaceae bacterium]|nr:hypothetical protein [Polyangiaceae bacterium]